MGGMLALAAAPVFGAAGRAAALDWAMAESAMALGLAPVALAEARAFAALTPVAALDFGRRGAPNREALSLAAPDLILSSSYYAFIEPRLAAIAPVFAPALYVAGEPPLPKVMAVLDDLAPLLGAPAAPVRAAAGARIGALAARLAGYPRPVVVIEPGDRRHVRVFGADSLYAGVLERLGLANGWQGGTEFAFAAPVPLTDLAGLGDVQLVLHGAPPVQVAARLERSALWAALGPVRAGRVVTLPRRNAFGGLPSPLAFAGDLGAAA